MFAKVLFPLLFALSPTPQVKLGEPVVLKAARPAGLWAVVGALDGKPTIFLVDSGAPRTVLPVTASRPQGDVRATVEVGGLTYIVTAYAYKVSIFDRLGELMKFDDPKIEPSVAILGMDALATMAVGIDYRRSEITIWPSFTGLPKKTAQDWVLDGFEGAKAERLGLPKRFETRPGLTLQFGKWKGDALFDTGADATSVLPKFLPEVLSAPIYEMETLLYNSTAATAVRLAPSLKVEGIEFPWARFRVNAAGADIAGSPSGVMSPSSLRSPRVFIDFSGRSVYFVRPDKEIALGQALSDLLACPLVAEGDQIFVAGALPGVSEDRAGSEVVSIAQRAAKDVLEALRGKKKDSLAFLAALAADCRKDYTLSVKGADGPESLKVKGVTGQ